MGQRTRRTMPCTDTTLIAPVCEADFVRSIRTGNHLYHGRPRAEHLFKPQSASHDAYQATLTFFRRNVNRRGNFFGSGHLSLLIERRCFPTSIPVFQYLGDSNWGGRFPFSAEMPSFISSEIMVITWDLASNSMAVDRSMVNP